MSTSAMVAEAESPASDDDPILDAAIVDLMSRGDLRIPPYPAVALRIRDVIARGDYGLDELGRLAASDQVLAGDTLRVANSAAYARGTAVTSVKQAVARLGAQDLARVALASRIGALATAAGRLAALRRRAWLDGLASAFLCQALAKRRRVAPDVAFAAGLLHDFGQIVAITCLERIAAEASAAAARPEDVWRGVAQRYHVELGVVMAARWALPPVLADAIALHHRNSFAGASDPALLQLVAAVDQITALLAREAAVGPEELATLSQLERGEIDGALGAIRDLPVLVASFEAAGASAQGETGLVAAPPPAALGEAPPLPVLLAVDGKAHRYRLTGLAPNQFVAVGRDEVAAHVLLEMMVEDDEPIEGHAVVQRTWMAEGERHLLVKPYALHGSARERWTELVRARTQDAPAPGLAVAR